ncbi:MAG: alpha/beta hydrolase [Myxococcota bacterium]
MKNLLRLGMVLALASGCGDDDDSMDNPDATPDAGMDGMVTPDGDAGQGDGGETPSACTMALEARRAMVMDQLAGWPVDDAPEMLRQGGDQALEADFAGRYRDDLANHPGCQPRAAYDGNSEPFVADNMATVPAGVPASINGYPCAAKEYTQAAEDATKPIVILVHGNSSGVPSFEEYFNADLSGTERQTSSMFSFNVANDTQVSLVTRLLADGYRVISFDARVDLVSVNVTDHNPDSMTGNAFNNIDHGWTVPMLQALIRAVLTENPDRQISVIGHSLGTTVIRDAMRRLYNEHRADANAVNPFSRTRDLVLLSGANHGVAAGMALCQAKPMQMAGTVTCEMGDRENFVPTYFSRRLNGPSDYFATPCADGSFAYGMEDQCGGNTVQYTTVTMRDLPGGMLQDEFVSEASSSLDLEGCVDNELIELTDFDPSGYFFTGAAGFFASHFGSARSATGIQLILDKLAD